MNSRVCIHGEWIGTGCLSCRWRVAQAVEVMRWARSLGLYDEQGFTPAERREQRARLMDRLFVSVPMSEAELGDDPDYDED
jgi:hypothetical protein